MGPCNAMGLQNHATDFYSIRRNRRLHTDRICDWENVDISEYLDFGFYDRVWYHENAGLGERLHSRWLGVSHRIGSLISYYITQGGGLSGCTPIESVTGKTVDILEYLDFGFYDRVWYHENAGLGERLHSRWLGVSHRIGSYST